jgi:subtilase family serine protease
LVAVMLAVVLALAPLTLVAAGSGTPGVAVARGVTGTVLGPLAGSVPLSIDIVLRPRDGAALDSFVASVTTPTSPHYGQYLAPGQFGSRFGATTSSVAAVSAALRAVGLDPGPATANGLVIPVAVTAAQAARAFGITFSRVRLASGRIAFDYQGTPLLDGAVAPEVAGIVGLSDVTELAPLLEGRADPVDALDPGTVAPGAIPGAAAACPAAEAVGPSNPGVDSAHGAADRYLTVDAVMKAYGADPLYGDGDLGQGVRIDAFEQEGNFPSDITTYEACFGIHTPVTYTRVGSGPASPDAASQDGLETELDIETLASVAPMASIDVYQAGDDNVDALAEYNAMIGADDAQVISTSWGACEDGDVLLGPHSVGFMEAERELFEQAAAQGQSILAAAGDSGSEDCALKVLNDDPIDPIDPIAVQEVDDPASDPFVTGVGGTELKVDAAGERSSEVVWNEGPAYSAQPRGAGGGGASHFWSMPAWQYQTLSDRGWLPAQTAPHAVCPLTLDPRVDAYCREVPDVSADAAPQSGLVIYWDGSWTHVGGTSAAAPQWAGLAALADSCAGDWGRGPVGFLNPMLYAMADNPVSYARAFTDITSGDNDYVYPPLDPEGYAAGPGYDMASGLGAPIVGVGNTGVVDQLCAGAPER